MKAFSYEYGRENRKLKELVAGWITGETAGGYVLSGPTGSGKTVMLSGMIREMNRSDETAKYLPGEPIRDALYRGIRRGTVLRENLIRSEMAAIVIDDLDDIVSGKPETERMLILLLRNLLQRRRLLVCVFNRQEIAKHFAENAGFTFVPVRAVKPNMRIVREKAKEVGVCLSGDKIREYSEFETMMELRMALNEEYNTWLSEQLSGVSFDIVRFN